MATPIAEQCRQEGFNRRLGALVKQAMNPRFPHLVPGPGKPAGEMLARGRQLHLALQNPATGPVSKFLKDWQAPHGVVESLQRHKSEFVRAASEARQLLAAAKARGDAAEAAKLQRHLELLRGNFRKGQDELYTALGVGSEGRRKFLEVGVPVMAGGAAVGGAGAAGMHYYTKEKSRRDTLGDLGNATFMDRLKYLMVPKATMSNRIFGSANS